MKHFAMILALSILSLAALSACQNYRTPSLSGDPAKMSSDTLCFRYASSKAPELGAEIARRNLDCAALLRDDPLLANSRELDNAYRIGR
ncbi:MAG: hypothetical protein AAF204_04555 [Pseudomonadota bacterium]